jgi:signal transduction histidine kinase
VEQVNVAEALESLLDFLRETFEDKGILVQTHGVDAPALVKIDPHQLRQVLLNLLNNARDMLPPGGLIEVAIEHDEDRVTLVVEDNGPGVPAADRERIFEPFFSTRDEGVGLGLALVRQYVTRHGGSVRCEPRPGGGSRFVVQFPWVSSPLSAKVLI